jgi:hypothetical protein
MPDGDVLDCLDFLRDICPQMIAGMEAKHGTMVIEHIPSIILAIPNPFAGSSELPVGAALPIWIFGAGGVDAVISGGANGSGTTPSGRKSFVSFPHEGQATSTPTIELSNSSC